VVKGRQAATRARAVGLALALGMAVAAFGGCARTGRQTVTVRGGPLLGEAFSAIADAFQVSHPDTRVKADFSCPPCLSPSSAATQVDFDVLVSAGKSDMSAFVGKGAIDAADVRDFGTTDLVVILPAQSKLSVHSLADLATDKVKRIDFGDPTVVSTGIYARQALEKAGLWAAVSPKVVESKTGCQVLKAVALGETDAGFSYAFCLANEREAVKLATVVDGKLHEPIVLQIGLTHRGATRKAAQDFVSYVLGPDGQGILRKQGVRPGPGSRSAP
jgi:molybdate transport system substrate-binding protein